MTDLIEKGKEVIDIILKFCLDELDSEWVKSVINADFTEADILPLVFEELHASTNFPGLFTAVLNTLRQYIDAIKTDGLELQEERRSSFSFLNTTSISEDEDEKRNIFAKFWRSATKAINIKSIQAFLCFYICKGESFDAGEHERELGIHAASLYFLLLSVPGSRAFRVFHPVLYKKALDILKLTTKLNVSLSNPKKSNQRGSKLSQRKSSEDNYGEGNDDEEVEVSYLSPTEANKLIRSLNILLNDFLRLSNKFSLKHSQESKDETVSVLVEVTKCEIHNAHVVFLQRHSANSLSALTYNAYVALQSLCNPLHGNIEKTVILIMKHLIYNILMISRGSSDLSIRALGVIREHTIIFVKYLMFQLKKDSFKGVDILIQHLCLRVPDKAGYREKTAKSVTEILRIFPLKEYSLILKWLFKLSHNEKAGHRLFTLEVISKLLAEEERSPESTETSVTEPTPRPDNSEVAENFQSLSSDRSVEVPVNRNVLSHKFLLCIIFSRCRDSAATVRSKALMMLAECTLSNNETILESMKQIFFSKEPLVFTTPHITNNEINCESPAEEFFEEMTLPNAEVVMSMLQRRAQDDKVTVRKSALQVMENLMKLKDKMITASYLKVLLDHCRDPALLIRKQMIQSLTSVVETYPANEIAVKAWVSGIFPLILDPEVKVQEKVVEYVDQLIFRRMRAYDNQKLTNEEKLPWKILDAIINLTLHKFFNKILLMWSKSEYMKPKVISVAKTHIDGAFSEQTWTFLSLVSQYIDIKDPLFALNYFEKSFHSPEVGSYTLLQVLKVISHSIKFIPAERALSLQKDLLADIKSLSATVELISPIVDTLTLITYAVEKDENKIQKEIEVWASPILKSCDEFLQHILFPDSPSVLSQEEEEMFFRYLSLLGEIAQLCPLKVNKRMFLMIQSIIFHDNHSLKSAPSRVPSTQTQSSQPPALSFNPTRRLKTLAVITLGKMCLQHEDQAKRIIPALGKMLDTTTLPSMKINIIVVLSDMCVRYATLVDPLMPQVTACLRDPDIQVRRITLTLLIGLLQEDYLKLKGSFFYRILQCLCDDDDDVRSTVIFYMTERLMKRFPKIFLQHFIECIFHYNCYEEHESYNKFNQSRQEKELFCLAGAKFREERMKLYRFMLDHMQDDQRFATTQRLCQDVLGGVVDGRIKLTPSSLPMLEDTLMVLSSDEIKLTWLKSRPEDADQPTDRAEQAEMAGIAIKKTIISQVVKRNVIENIVPILIALKNKLAENRSPLMKQLLLYFKEILKDYKNEVKEILAGDKQLSKEIEFDLRKLEEEQQKEKERLERDKNEKEQEEVLRDAQELKKKALSLGQSPNLENMKKAKPFLDKRNAISGDLDHSSKNSEHRKELTSAIGPTVPMVSGLLVEEKFLVGADLIPGESPSADNNYFREETDVEYEGQIRSCEKDLNRKNSDQRAKEVITREDGTNTTKQSDRNSEREETEREVLKSNKEEKTEKRLRRSKKKPPSLLQHALMNSQRTRGQSLAPVTPNDLDPDQSEPGVSDVGGGKGSMIEIQVRAGGELANMAQLSQPMEKELGEESTEATGIAHGDNEHLENVLRDPVRRKSAESEPVIEAAVGEPLLMEITLQLPELEDCTQTKPEGVERTKDTPKYRASKGDKMQRTKDSLLTDPGKKPYSMEPSGEKLNKETLPHEGKPISTYTFKTPEKAPISSPSRKPPPEVRENLMRAISTPNLTQRVISDVTFVDRTQEISSIGFDDTSLRQKDSEVNEASSSTLLLHFRSPEAFAKDDQFSLLRRGKCLSKAFSKEALKKRRLAETGKKQQAEKQTVKRSSGGFLESFTSEHETSDDSSLMDGPSKSKVHRKTEVRQRVKPLKETSLRPASRKKS